jgi:hypothetical protein
MRVGGIKRRVDACHAAANSDLEAMVERGTFRDLSLPPESHVDDRPAPAPPDIRRSSRSWTAGRDNAYPEGDLGGRPDRATAGPATSANILESVLCPVQGSPEDSAVGAALVRHPPSHTLAPDDDRRDGRGLIRAPSSRPAAARTARTCWNRRAHAPAEIRPSASCQ